MFLCSKVWEKWVKLIKAICCIPFYWHWCVCWKLTSHYSFVQNKLDYIHLMIHLVINLYWLISFHFFNCRFTKCSFYHPFNGSIRKYFKKCVKTFICDIILILEQHCDLQFAIFKWNTTINIITVIQWICKKKNALWVKFLCDNFNFLIDVEKVLMRMQKCEVCWTMNEFSSVCTPA